jgi:uncharacterized protein involved in exopolysaccharide biosynthesis
VLDQAVTPEKKSKPHRALIVILCTFMACVAGCFWAILLEMHRRAMRSPKKAALWGELMSNLRRY